MAQYAFTMRNLSRRMRAAYVNHATSLLLFVALFAILDGTLKNLKYQARVKSHIVESYPIGRSTDTYAEWQRATSRMSTVNI